MTMSIGTLSAAFFLTIAFILILRPLAIRTGLVDRPCGGRKRHVGEIPLVGGIGIFLGIVVTDLLFGGTLRMQPILWCAAFLLALGVADDLFGLSARLRLLAQAASALAMIYGSGVVLRNLGDIFFTGNPVLLGVLAVPVTTFCYVGVINAMNMVDGLDGLAAGLALVTLSVLSWFSATAGTWHLFLLAPATAATAAFLLFNARSPFNSRAKIFLGDAGSMFLGSLLATMLIDMSQIEPRVFSPATALWIFAIPLMDTVGVIIRRLSRGQSPLHPGRDHFHHILVRAGLSVGQTTLLLVTVAVVFAGLGIAGHRIGVPTKTMFFAFLATFALYFWATARGWRYVHRINRQRKRQARANDPVLPFLVPHAEEPSLEAEEETEDSVPKACGGSSHRRN